MNFLYYIRKLSIEHKHLFYYSMNPNITNKGPIVRPSLSPATDASIAHESNRTSQIHSGSNPMPLDMSSLASSMARSQLSNNAAFNDFKKELDMMGKGPDADTAIQAYLDTCKSESIALSNADFMSLMRRLSDDNKALKESLVLERMEAESQTNANMSLNTFLGFFSEISSEESETTGIEIIHAWPKLATMDERIKRITIDSFLKNLDKLRANGVDKSLIKDQGIVNDLKAKSDSNTLSLPQFLSDFAKLSHRFHKQEALKCLQNWPNFQNINEAQKVTIVKVLLNRLKDEDACVLGPYLIDLIVEKAEIQGTAVSQKEIVELTKGLLDREGFTAPAYMKCEESITLAHHKQAIQKYLFENCFPKWDNAKKEDFLIHMNLNTEEHRAQYLR
jgi:hypothetical protein